MHPRLIITATYFTLHVYFSFRQQANHLRHNRVHHDLFPNLFFTSLVLECLVSLIFWVFMSYQISETPSIMEKFALLFEHVVPLVCLVLEFIFGAVFDRNGNFPVTQHSVTSSAGAETDNGSEEEDEDERGKEHHHQCLRHPYHTLFPPSFFVLYCFWAILYQILFGWPNPYPVLWFLTDVKNESGNGGNLFICLISISVGTVGVWGFSVWVSMLLERCSGGGFGVGVRKWDGQRRGARGNSSSKNKVISMMGLRNLSSASVSVRSGAAVNTNAVRGNGSVGYSLLKTT
jgi:hypothetical protein